MTTWHPETGATAQKPTTQIKKRDDRKNSDGSLADLPEWLEEFTENLEESELPADAYTSHDSDLERPTKLETKSRKHIIYTHVPKVKKLRSLLANQNDKGSLQKTHWRSSTSNRS